MIESVLTDFINPGSEMFQFSSCLKINFSFNPFIDKTVKSLCAPNTGTLDSAIVMVEIEESNSIFFSGMNGSKLPIVVSHGEGRAALSKINYSKLNDNKQICISYIDNDSKHTSEYPHNPNGSYKGIAGISSESGNVTLMMPHPERLIDIKQFPTINDEKISPWSKFFYNARMHLK